MTHSFQGCHRMWLWSARFVHVCSQHLANGHACMHQELARAPGATINSSNDHQGSSKPHDPRSNRSWFSDGSTLARISGCSPLERSKTRASPTMRHILHGSVFASRFLSNPIPAMGSPEPCKELRIRPQPFNSLHVPRVFSKWLPGLSSQLKARACPAFGTC